MRTRLLSVAVACALAMMLSSLGSAAPLPKGRTQDIKSQIASRLTTTRYIPPYVRMAPIAPSQIRIRTTTDKTHGVDGHVHVIGHEVRNVSFKALGLGGVVEGTAKSNTVFVGARPTTVSTIKVLVPKDWGKAPK